MNNITPHPVLGHVVNIIKNVISDIKIDYTSESTVNLKDGNAFIILEQQLDSDNNSAIILIQDPKDIIFSEDLLPDLKHLHDGTKGELKTALQNATVIINDLNVATQIIFQSAKDAFDQISNSYELIRIIEKAPTRIKSRFKFGSNLFELTILDEEDKISINAEFEPSFNEAIKKTITEDTLKVQDSLNSIFK
ncbi:hypothetical protein [Pedobacter gandavensis]|uniref:hypothetical protein n=1 Tax=Pedobacter gandavensis TaxID=2679963 RepID=UPI00292D5191|nr:hypothetical protein [Pedobacter gandavensis]